MRAWQLDGICEPLTECLGTPLLGPGKGYVANSTTTSLGGDRDPLRSSVDFYLVKSRVECFAFITPYVNPKPSVGIVVSLITHGNNIRKFLAVFECASEAVTVTRSRCAKNLEDIYQFSEPPVSEQAWGKLCRSVRRFLHVNTSRAVPHMRVMNLTPKDKTRITDRANEFVGRTLILPRGRWDSFLTFPALR
ncbi:hypothetical protein OSTOST_19956 [Ostertagia ostertagi]